MARLRALYWLAASELRSWQACWAGPVKRGQDVCPLGLRPALPDRGPLEGLEVRPDIVVRSQFRQSTCGGGGRRVANVLGEPDHGLAEERQALLRLPLARRCSGILHTVVVDLLP